MKKSSQRKAKDKKLLLTVDKVRDLKPVELGDVAGGGHACCATYPSGGNGGGI